MRARGILAATAADSKAGARCLLIDSEWHRSIIIIQVLNIDHGARKPKRCGVSLSAGPTEVFVDEDVAYVEKLNVDSVACELLPKERWEFSNDADASLSLPDFKEAFSRSTQKIEN